MKIFCTILLVLLFVSCKSKTKSSATERTPNTKDSITAKPASNNTTGQLQTKRFQYKEYVTDFDYFFIEVGDENGNRNFIVNEFDDSGFSRGDSIEVVWKQDTIYIAGDGETPELADWAINIVKVKDGNVSLFRKEYPQPLRYLMHDTTSYATGFRDKIYLLVEYYLANTENELLQLIMKKSFSSLIYSMEDQERDGHQYVMIGLAEEFEHRLNTFQWIFIDKETTQIFEYDLPNDKLIPFK